MNANEIYGYQGLRVETQAMIENEQTPFLCFHFDKMSKRVFIMADSESLKKVQELRTLLDIENILKTTFEEGKKLILYDQKFEAGPKSIYLNICKPQNSMISIHSKSNLT